MKYRCWVVDDEIAAHKGLSMAFSDYKDFIMCAHYYSIDELPEQQPKNVDVIFLDIEMPRADGFSLFELWQNPLPLVVFVTAYNRYALKAFKYNAFDYLLKPLEKDMVEQLVENLRQRLLEKQAFTQQTKFKSMIEQFNITPNSQAISLQTDEGLFRVKIKDIFYLEAVGDFVAVYFNDKSLLTRSTLKGLVLELNNEIFVQIHRSFVINTTKIIKIEKGRFGDGQVRLNNEQVLKVSRRYKHQILNVITK
ncbi:LytR/AlgR family response regulator transcription factor [Pseudoalteromonas denitrificans]|jgi:two-component system LytT family response regulator|uniref:Two component transcriptional regulator, LytTR family n=1 Tax=Pseudoalteromonas denitrificans DSM 6059 TaxID=1123010 RepID=A0A1I1M2X5_9GAMM|nr:LytTR family DNA-binding domain-containing protein [Pseudoalteromonas denitrificans]SFC79406.1 two component transcriptional regulator, LytTR family [Pseudoalteromonas denitrificans DSM 6059]